MAAANSTLHPSIIRILESYIDRRGIDECWPWTGGVNSIGRGKFWAPAGVCGPKRVSMSAPRASYQLWVGDLSGEEIRQVCKNPRCCNPGHLRRSSEVRAQPTPRSAITVDNLKARFNYDPESGVLTWRVKPSRRGAEGSVAGGVTPSGYRIVRCKGRRLLAHRVAWAMNYGRWPTGEIDHINCIRDDNRICNLRETNRTGNNRNTTIRRDNTTGFKGVCRLARSGRYQATISINGRRCSLGVYDTAQEAGAVWAEAAKVIYGEFANLRHMGGPSDD